MAGPLIFGGSSNRPLLERTAAALGVAVARTEVEHFPDGEVRLELLEDVRGQDVYAMQSTHAPVGENLLELLLLVDAARRSGAARITALIPYFGYARGDRRENRREPLSARLVAELISVAGVDRLVALDLHSAAVEGCFKLPLEHLTASQVLAERIAATERPAVVVSPDLGAVKLAERYAAALSLPLAVVHKQRLSGHDVKASGVVGEVKGLAPLIVDDMITTAGTMAAAAEALLERGCAPEITLCATHGLFVGPAVERLKKLPLKRVVTTDSVPPTRDLPLPIDVVSVAPLFAAAVKKLA